MYGLYFEFCKEKQVNNPVKESLYISIFNTQLNLSFKQPDTDTYLTCDILESIHLQMAEKARSTKNDAQQLAKDSSATIKAISSHLQKTSPSQSWTYNYGVHGLLGRRAAMCMWHKGETSRGSQEIGLCFLKYVQQLPPSYGNKKSFHFWIYIVKHTSLQTIDHKFLISYHSYMECDQDFVLKHHQYITSIYLYLMIGHSLWHVHVVHSK
ncbi:hypothetical protein PR048_010445 [Dryococelus australis]|uniref:Uncharacterized protein n=1 Tax=Dryococelus australis TaxID=614101 RepID=A0ABQ9I2T1_9NEOP|nr:hypothetical protein PR048_010445 [Dryococelus australis]